MVSVALGAYAAGAMDAANDSHLDARGRSSHSAHDVVVCNEYHLRGGNSYFVGCVDMEEAIGFHKWSHLTTTCAQPALTMLFDCKGSPQVGDAGRYAAYIVG